MCDLRKILLVDDEPLIHERYSALFKASQKFFRGEVGIGVAHSWREAADIVARDRPDVVLLDLTMPPDTAESTIEHIARVHAEWPPILAFTSHDEMAGYRRKCLAAGAVDYWRKVDVEFAPHLFLTSAYHEFLKRNRCDAKP